MSIRLIAGDCRDVLPTLAADSVQCVVCSPPYWNLRDYGTALWDGGDAACDHANGRQGATRRDVSPERLAERAALYGTGTGAGSDVPPQQYRDTCGKCGAVRIDRQIGLEASPDAYLATMVAVFREVRRVLRPDGTCWVNMGDSYAGGKQGRADTGPDDLARRAARYGTGTGAATGPREFRQNAVPDGLAAKQLLLMPARLALALQADGWWVRSDIIWHKPNPMPESCTDRPTSAHEHVFLLTKSARYFYDADAVREASDASEASKARYAYGRYEGAGDAKRFERSGKPDYLTVNGNDYGQVAGTRNLRNVWTIATSPFSAAHFATFPPELAERCIRAGTSERGCCAACGAPWRRVTEKQFTADPRSSSPEKAADRPKPLDASNGWNGMPRGATSATTTGWHPGCEHGAEVVPCRVLDPFAGAGTTLLVADRLQRDAIGIELSPDYTTMAMERCRADAPLFADMHPPPAEDPEEARQRELLLEPEYGA